MLVYKKKKKKTNTYDPNDGCGAFALCWASLGAMVVVVVVGRVEVVVVAS